MSLSAFKEAMVQARQWSREGAKEVKQTKMRVREMATLVDVDDCDRLGMAKRDVWSCC